MISGYIQNGLMQKAMDFVWFMIHNGPKMDGFTFATVLSACASIAALDSGMEIHAFGIRSHLETDVVVGSALVDMYGKSGRIDYASRVFESMNSRNEFSWNSMISGYARHGNGDKALKVFREMQQWGQEPDLVTFVGVLSACSHAGLVEEGSKYFESMKNHGLVPQMEHYSCMIDILGRTGKLNEMEDFIKKMPVRPNNLIWRTVLVACRRSKDGAKSGIWKQASEMLLELEPENPVNYVLISSMYAYRGRWEDVAKTRTAMRTLPVKKEAGRSWVTLHDGLHVFVAGDKFALYDIDMETKEELLSYHSEKLAVAFVLTRSCRVPIRIMKNLRVCGDCHSAFCYISKIVGRKITLRDCNRFHHFENGKCSCGDFW
ncbi:repeat-containing protein [Musa troglodytarum]|uniref:Repeat-containing protein n=1 Tax=Musa troglodytarum TaxID=320322 RepID=A0A9E7F6N1_9LILI|nr:repeat-containing protein [Musa troglodytarum]